mmetsp:Transcript_18701/g.24682  ORF Transcript_18701/g.24682 Transcript_18701/m.24682 type:complete len:157 (+) Transcript_18701:158-628(+)
MASFAETTKICGYKPPQYFWFVVSGGLCDILQLGIDQAVKFAWAFPYQKATVCWTISYILSIVLRHTSHRIIVFGEFEGSYFWSLGKMYMTYASAIIISILTNLALTNILGMTHEQAWVITLLWTGLLNYFLLKCTWNSKKKTGDEFNSSKEANFA